MFLQGHGPLSSLFHYKLAGDSWIGGHLLQQRASSVEKDVTSLLLMGGPRPQPCAGM